MDANEGFTDLPDTSSASSTAGVDLTLRLNLSLRAQAGTVPVSHHLRPICSNVAAPDPPNSSLGRSTRSRRVHTKSRAGCYSCKRRRIKCPENLPTCSNCLERDLECRWPDLIRETMRRETPTSASLPVQVRPPGPTFTMQDFRLFHYFLQEAYPHQPVGNDSVWTHEIPSIAHSHEYLMHSMLALSASELYEMGDKTPELKCLAMEHRLKAVTSLKKALVKGLPTAEEANAMLAASYNLLFQACNLDDGFVEFMSLVRGNVLIALHMGCKQLRFLFKNLMGEEQLEMVRPGLENVPAIDPGLAHPAIESIRALEPLCQQEYEKSFLKALLQTATALLTSPYQSYAGIQMIFVEFAYKMKPEEFNSFINPENDVGQLLQSHFVALQTIMDPISEKEMLDRPKPKTPPNTTARWLRPLHQNIKPNMKKYLEWPIAREKTMKEKLERWYENAAE